MPSSFFVIAEDIDRSNIGIPDFYLYNELLNLANTGRETPLLKLETNALSNREEITITNSQIESINGLELLNLSNLKTLNLSNNKIKLVTSQSLSGLTNLEVLNLSFNDITEINVSGLLNLNTLLLEANKISQIDLSNIIFNTTYGNGYVNLKSNNFISLLQITLPSEEDAPILVDLNNNYLVQETIGEYTQTHQLELLTQGIKQNDSLLEGSLLQVYETSYYTGFNVKVYDEQQNFITQVNANESATLAPNNYTLYYFNNNTPLYSDITQLPKEFIPVNFTIKLQKPTVEVKVNNEVVEAKPVYKEPITLNFSSYNTNADIYYSINNLSWTLGSEVILEFNGQYNIRVRARLNEMYSDTFQISLNINEPWQNTQNAIKAVTSITLITLIFIGGYIYYKKRTS